MNFFTLTKLDFDYNSPILASNSANFGESLDRFAERMPKKQAWLCAYMRQEWSEQASPDSAPSSQSQSYYDVPLVASVKVQFFPTFYLNDTSTIRVRRFLFTHLTITTSNFK